MKGWWIRQRGGLIAAHTFSWEASLEIQSTAYYLQCKLLMYTDHRVVNSEHRYCAQAHSSYNMRITSQNGGEQKALRCSVAVMNI